MSKKVLILVAHRKGRSPSQRYRFEQYLPFLESKGYTFEWSNLLDAKADRDFYAAGGALRKVGILLSHVWQRMRDWRRMNSYDVVFIQREALFLGSGFFEHRAYRSGAHVIFDFDDAIWKADTSPGNQKWEWVKRPAKFFDNVAHAHVVLAGNAYLAEQARKVNKNVLLVPTTVDTAFHKPLTHLRGGPVVCIGWSGSVSTVKHFVSLLPVLRRIEQQYGAAVRFRLFGDANFKSSHPKVEALAWTEASEVDVLNSFDIGLMPLPDDEWARGKCGLKALTYLACGVPAVVSPVGVNADIVQPGVSGLHAVSDDEWYEALCKLIDDVALRKQMGVAGRTFVEKHYSVEANKHLYLEAFEKRQK